MVTTRGMGYFIPYQSEVAPSKLKKCSPRLNFFVSFQNKRCTATRGLYAHAAAKCKQGKEPQGIFNQTVRPADTNFWVSNQYTHGQGMKVLQNKAMQKRSAIHNWCFKISPASRKDRPHLTGLAAKGGRIHDQCLQSLFNGLINKHLKHRKRPGNNVK